MMCFVLSGQEEELRRLIKEQSWSVGTELQESSHPANVQPLNLWGIIYLVGEIKHKIV